MSAKEKLIVAAIVWMTAASALAKNTNWLGYGNDSAERRFSPLTEITEANVSRLGLVAATDLPGETALAATPLAVNGVLYFTGSFAAIYAVQAKTGRLLWKYDPKTNEADPHIIRQVWPVNRGAAYWDGKVYVATKDGRMIAVDAQKGTLLWSTKFLLPNTNTTSTGAPRVFNGKVIIGNSGAEYAGRGYVTALDGNTGKVLWRFFTVPGNPSKGFEDDAMAMAAKTWGGEWWKYGGGGTPWNAITFDEKLNQIYIGTGNGGPWNSKFRAPNGEDNLFLTSVVALDADTGKYKWHIQYNPEEAWDWKATADIVLTELKIDGKKRDVLMQAPSNGFFYVIDRHTGKLISAEKIGKVTWADHIDLKTGRPVEKPGIRGENGPFIVYPSSTGSHNWQAMSYSPKTGLVYIPYIQIGMTVLPRPPIDKAHDVTADSSKMLLRLGVPIQRYVDPNDPLDERGSLLAWDPVAQKLRWRVDYPTYVNAGTMVTAGNVVFQGTNIGQFYAYAADTGKRLWSFDAKLGIIAPPISYAVDGRQYISLLVGYGALGGGGGPNGGMGRNQGWKYGLQPRRLLTFALDGKAALPPTPPADFSVHKLDDAKITLDPARARKGGDLYLVESCADCHGAATYAAGSAPDLRESPIAFDRDAFKCLLREGSLVSNGMPLFDDLTDEEIEDIYQYIRRQARGIDAAPLSDGH